jgi:Family of unknown function (DUF6010)
MSPPSVTYVDALAAVVIAGVFIVLMSAVPEPARQRFNAVFVAGAGSVYFSGGLGFWEFALPTVITFCAYRGLTSYRFIGLAWLAHTAFDVLHHLWGSPIIAVAPTSSFGCAVCDPLLAVWFFAGAPSVFEGARRLRAS